ncbi:MAG: YtrH family sporulation protein [Syntrophomonadaceae bacterium]|nr:YtrH family sporulation protein [Syntrophomonadaceae bacterium]
METFVHKSILIFFTALGIILGSSLLGSLAAILVREPPIGTMLKLAQEIKIWAIVAAIGGTFSTFEIFQSGLFQGELRPVVKQLIYILCALAGTQAGYYLLLIISEEGK